MPIPDDPTNAFWEVPFKVPAYVLLAASAAWIALEKMGVRPENAEATWITEVTRSVSRRRLGRSVPAR